MARPSWLNTRQHGGPVDSPGNHVDNISFDDYETLTEVLKHSSYVRGFVDGVGSRFKKITESVDSSNKETKMGTSNDPVQVFAAQEQANLTAIQNQVADVIVPGIQALDDLIQKFQNSPGTLPPADQSALDAISAASANLVKQVQAVDVSVPVVNPPAGNPTPGQPSTAK